MKILSTTVLLITFMFVSLPNARAQTVLTGNNITISTIGSYSLGSNTNSVSITASNVTLNLSGYAVQSTANCTLINSGDSPGCICSASQCGGNTSGITISGSNVVVKDGIVKGHFGNGILISPTLGNANVILQNILVTNNMGNGINIVGNGVTMINVQSIQNGHFGIVGARDMVFDNVSANYNNQSGIQTGSSSIFKNVTVSSNIGSGIFAAGVAKGIRASSNTSSGMIFTGTVSDAYLTSNGGDGLNGPGPGGIIANSVATFNSGNGFTFGSSICYFGLSTTGNTGSQISGGNALVGTAKCP